MPVHHTNSEQETAAVAAALAAQAHTGDVFFLDGPLGAGKSVFARAFIRALCGEDTEVPSPTFTLVQTYDTPESSLWHFDLYRLTEPDEIYELGWEDCTHTIRLIEWPDRLGPHAPENARRITIEPLDKTGRKITIDD